MHIKLKHAQEFNAIYAALALYREENMGDPGYRSDHIHKLACGEAKGMDEDISLDDEGLADLITAIGLQAKDDPVAATPDGAIEQLQAAVAYHAPQLDDPDVAVSGADLVDFFVAWRAKAKAVIEAAKAAAPMPTFLVRPDFRNGGDEWQMMAVAKTAREAIDLVYAELDHDDATLDLKQEEDQPKDCWTVWQLPDIRPGDPRVLTWDHFEATFWVGA